MKTKQSLIPFGINAPLICIEWVLISQLKLNARNARVHPDAQIVMLARSIDTFGITKPIIIDELNRVLCGNAIVQAAERLGMTSVPAVRLTHLTKEQKRALAIADNKLAEKSVWDFDVLKTELLSIIDVEPDFDLFAIGFETPELDIILDVADEHDDALPELAPDRFVAQPGDLFRLGNHCIYCGDARDTRSYDAALGTERARLVVTDPPYNVRIDGHAGGSGAVKHAEFVMASGEMGDSEFKTFLKTVLAALGAHSLDGALHHIFMDWRHIEHLLASANGLYSEFKNLCVWRKANAGMGSLYRSQHELCFVFKYGTAPHVNNVNLGKDGRNRGNVWDYAGVNSFGRGRDQLLAMHPTVKPLALIADIIKDASKRGDFILDPFGGSGTTLIAAEKTGRRAALLELDPRYVDVIVRRWEAYTGCDAICTRTGMTFAEREQAKNPK